MSGQANTSISSSVLAQLLYPSNEVIAQNLFPPYYGHSFPPQPLARRPVGPTQSILIITSASQIWLPGVLPLATTVFLPRDNNTAMRVHRFTHSRSAATESIGRTGRDGHEK